MSEDPQPKILCVAPGSSADEVGWIRRCTSSVDVLLDPVLGDLDHVARVEEADLVIGIIPRSEVHQAVAWLLGVALGQDKPTFMFQNAAHPRPQAPAFLGVLVSADEVVDVVHHLAPYVASEALTSGYIDALAYVTSKYAVGV